MLRVGVDPVFGQPLWRHTDIKNLGACQRFRAKPRAHVTAQQLFVVLKALRAQPRLGAELEPAIQVLIQCLLKGDTLQTFAYPTPMRYWWVNQNQTFRHELAGGYLWSPKRNANGPEPVLRVDAGGVARGRHLLLC
jgi:hypothetical protein